MPGAEVSATLVETQKHALEALGDRLALCLEACTLIELFRKSDSWFGELSMELDSRTRICCTVKAPYIC